MGFFLQKMNWIYFSLWYACTWCIKHAEECTIIVEYEGSRSHARSVSCRVKVILNTNLMSCDGQGHMLVN